MPDTDNTDTGIIYDVGIFPDSQPHRVSYFPLRVWASASVVLTLRDSVGGAADASTAPTASYTDTDAGPYAGTDHTCTDA